MLFKSVLSPLEIEFTMFEAFKKSFHLLKLEDDLEDLLGLVGEGGWNFRLKKCAHSDDDVKSFLTFNYKTRMRTTENETKEKRF